MGSTTVPTTSRLYDSFTYDTLFHHFLRSLSSIHESTGFPEVASAILLRVSICTVLVTVNRLREDAYCATVDNAKVLQWRSGQKRSSYDVYVSLESLTPGWFT